MKITVKSFILLLLVCVSYLSCKKSPTSPTPPSYHTNKYIDTAAMNKVPVVLEVKSFGVMMGNMGIHNYKALVLGIIKNNCQVSIPDTIGISGWAECISRDFDQQDTSLIVYLQYYHVDIDTIGCYYNSTLYRSRYSHYAKCLGD